MDTKQLSLADFYLNDLLNQYAEKWPQDPDFLDDYEHICHFPEFQQALRSFKLKINSKYFEPNHEKRYYRREIFGCIYIAETEKFKNLNKKIDEKLNPISTNEVIKVLVGLFNQLIKLMYNHPFLFLLGIGFFYQYYMRSQMAAGMQISHQNFSNYCDNSEDSSTAKTNIIVKDMAALNGEELREHIKNKLIIEYFSTENECEKLVPIIAEAITDPYFSDDTQLYVLGMPAFKIVCTNEENKSKARFDMELKQILFFRKRLPLKKTVRHELRHAFNSFYHERAHALGRCHFSHFFNYTLPVYPQTEAEIQAYHDAFSQGENRLAYSYQLFEKQENEELTESENEFYQKFISSLDGLLPIEYIKNISEEEFYVLNKQVPPFRYEIYKNVFGTITELKKLNKINVPYIQYRIDDMKNAIKFLISYLPDRFQEYQNYFSINQNYINNIFNAKAASIEERETTFLEFFPKKAAAFIFKEVIEKKIEYENKCGNFREEKFYEYSPVKSM